MNTGDMNSPLNAGREERLWDYIDGLSSPGEKLAIEQLIETNPAWKTKYHELLDVKQLLQSSELEEPSLRFTKNVMEQITKQHIAPATRTYINKNIIRGLAIFFITIIVGFLIYGIGQVEWVTSKESRSTIPVDFSKVDYSKMFNNDWVNAFMMINVILGLFLLDRYLANKRKRFREEP